MAKRGIALHTIMHVVAALHRQRHIIAERPRDVVGPRTERYHRLASLDRACLSCHTPARAFVAQATRIGLKKASALRAKRSAYAFVSRPGSDELGEPRKWIAPTIISDTCGSSLRNCAPVSTAKSTPY